MQTLEGIGAFVRRRRLEMNLTQSELADAIGLSRSHLAQIELGKIAFPNADIRRRLANGLKVSHLDLLVAAGEITEDEISKAGASSSAQDGPLETEVIEMIRGINWNENRTELVRRIFQDLFEGAPR